AAGYHYRVRDEIEMALDEIPPNTRQSHQRAPPGLIPSLRGAGPIVRQELRPGILTRSQKDRVGMCCRLPRQRRHMQSAEAHMRSPSTVAVGYLIGPPGRCYVYLNHHDIWLVIKPQFLDVFIRDDHLIGGVEITGERREAKRGEQGIL